MRTKLTTEQKKRIKSGLSMLKSKGDLVALLNEVAVMIYGELLTKPFDLKHITYYANPSISEKRYSTFEIKKRSGKSRVINSPVSGLKSILRCLSVILECSYQPHSSANGFVAGKSIVSNAQKHINRQNVYNIDLKDFFHSFDRNRVKMGIWKQFFNLEKDREELAFLIAALCTHPIEVGEETRIVLPQGSPTSPVLTNMLCLTLDRRLEGLAKRFRIRYSRYADDITFSSDRNVFRNPEFLKELNRIIEEDQKLEINPAKTRLQKKGYRQEVTGVIVNEKPNVHQKYIKQLRMWIYYIEKYGMNKAESLFRKDYIRDKGHVKYSGNPMVSVIIGKLLYLKMVKGENAPVYVILKSRFEKAIGKENEIDALLDIWEKRGIIEAIAFFEGSADKPKMLL